MTDTLELRWLQSAEPLNHSATNSDAAARLTHLQVVAHLLVSLHQHTPHVGDAAILCLIQGMPRAEECAEHRCANSVVTCSAC